MGEYMSETNEQNEQYQQQADQQQQYQSQSQEKPPNPNTPDLFRELHNFGNQLEQVVRGAWESEQAKTFQRDIATGVEALGHQVHSAMSSVKKNEEFTNLTERGQKAVNEFQESEFVRDLHNVLAQGMSQLNQQLADFVNNMNQPRPDQPDQQEGQQQADQPKPKQGYQTSQKIDIEDGNE
jgi:hypothetical protein